MEFSEQLLQEAHKTKNDEKIKEISQKLEKLEGMFIMLEKI